MRSISLVLLTGLVIHLGACGDDESTVPPDARPVDGSLPPDATPPDAAPPDAMVLPAIGIGEACPVGNECGPGLFCLDENIDPSLPPYGYCTAMCTSDADCGGDAFCSPTPIGDPGSPHLCFQKCATDAAGCSGAPDRICSTSLFGFLDLGQLACIPGDATAIDGSPCLGYLGSCNVNQMCFTHPFEAPGGMCLTLGCTVGDDSTCTAGGDGVCIMGDGTNVCVDACTTSAECREAEGYECVMALPGTLQQLCFFVHAQPGESCGNDVDCGAAGSAWRCLGGPDFPGGYCSGALGTCDPMDDTTCPNDSTCYDPSGMPGDEYCAATCATDTDCRAIEGYSCVDLGMGLLGCVPP